MTSHIEAISPKYGPVPLCGRANWDELTRKPELAECWECRSIAGLPPKEESCPDEPQEL